MPKSNADFWEAKFARNVQRDAANVEALVGSGWRVCIVWECAIRQRGKQIVGDEVAEWIIGTQEGFRVIPANP